MRYPALLSELPDGSFQAACLDPPAVACGATAEEAASRLREEIVYRLEYCPCSTLGAEESVELDLQGPPLRD